LSAGRLDAIAASQYAAVPLGTATLSSGHSHAGVIVAGIALVLIVAVALVALLVVRSRRTAQVAAGATPLPGGVPPLQVSPWEGFSWEGGATQVGGVPPGPPAGWYPDPGGGVRRRYWTGTEWGPTEPST
jgi:hypothetical protein